MTQRAICVGINRFKRYPQFALNGCVNDAQDMARWCRESLGFKPRQVKLLTDRKATKAAIMAALTKAVDAACAGKVKAIVFSFSSHGTQVADASGDEADGMDEAFVPYDVDEDGDRWHPDHIITDDEFNALFARLPDAVTLEVFLDTCHSGTGLRGAEFGLHAPRPRFIAPPAAEFQGPVHQRSTSGFRLSPPATATAPGAVRGRARKAKARASASASMASTASAAARSSTPAAADADQPVAGRNHVLWTGCKSNQTSADAWFDGQYFGAFTFHYLKVMRATKGSLSRQAVITQVREAMKGAFTQVPQLEGHASNRQRAIAY